MAIWHITGGNRLYGPCFVQGSKNSALPILAASVITPCVTELMNVPRLSDVEGTLRILRRLGCIAELQGNDVYIDSRQISCCEIPRELMETMRSSVLFMGALLARCGEVRLSRPGGCKLGERPVDMHLSALEALGAEIEEDGCTISCRAKKLTGGHIELRYPSVGATENAMIAASLADGVTTIHGAAKEPEIVELQEYLRKLGAYISGAGSGRISVCGFSAENHVGHRVMPDRIAAATLLCATAACGGEIELRGIEPSQISTVRHFLNAAGCDIISGKRSIRLTSSAALSSVPDVVTGPYPEFPTDAQPLLMAALLKAKGRTVFKETVFDSRFAHASELARFGADISVSGREATVWGVGSLAPAIATSTDLRGGAAVLIAALSAEGRSMIIDAEHIARGYENLDGQLRALGADIYMEK